MTITFRTEQIVSLLIRSELIIIYYRNLKIDSGYSTTTFNAILKFDWNPNDETKKTLELNTFEAMRL